MIKRSLILILLLGIVVVGCGQPAPQKQVVAKVNNYEITKDKFEAEFKESIYGRSDTLETRKEFLENLISRKLILQDASSHDLDKQPGFLRMIERFWEQSLLKVALDRKMKKIANTVAVSEAQVVRLYEAMAKEGKTDKPYEKIREQLRQEIIEAESSREINEWISQLNKQAQIKINYELLNQK